jgi:hypothetical protein
MDVWGMAGAVAGNLAEGRKHALEAKEQSKTSVKPTDVTINGK